VQNEDGLHDRGASAWEAAQFDQDLPGLERGDRALTAGADLRVCPVDLQFFYLFRVAERLAAAADDVAAAVRDGAMGVGEEHGLPLLRFPLAETAAAHLAAENGVVGKALVDLT